MQLLGKYYLEECKLHHTHFVLQFTKTYSNETLKEVLSSEEFDNIDYVFNPVEKMIFFSIFDKAEKPKKYEKTKKAIIETLGMIDGTYLSILYDSQTVEYLEKISSSIYELERNFRNLIEIKMLRQVGPLWRNQYLVSNDNTYDRKTGRKDDVFKYLANPLDDHNFKNLSVFVKENIRRNRSIITEKLDLLDSKLDILKAAKKSEDLNEITDDIVDEINQLKISVGNANDLYSEDIYAHIKPDLVEEWNRIYDYRNYWAHNIFLMTEAEYNEYLRLSQRINKKIKVELTIDSLLGSLNFKDYGNFIRISISKYENEVVNCEVKIKFNLNGKFYYVSKLEADYIDIYNFYKVLFSKQADFIAKLDSTYLRNPYLYNILSENEKFPEWFEDISEEDSNEIINILTSVFKFNVKTANESGEGLVVVNEDHHSFLKRIFS
ncbi:hypothetical protein [Paenibacillus sp. FSL P2-0121]